MIFVKSSNLASNRLRADQIAAELGATSLLNDLPKNLNGTVVFVKDAIPGLVQMAKYSDCTVVYDPIDTFAYPERAQIKPWHSLVDIVIAYNPVQKVFYQRWFNNVVIIPHQWDIALDGMFCEYDRFKPAYIGYAFNRHQTIHDVDLITDPKDMLPMAPRYNCHLTIRDTDSYQSVHKPATKLSTAAAVGAVCLTTKDHSAQWLLPEDYPYWVNNPQDVTSVLAQAEKEFCTDKWNEALAILAGVRNKTSLREIAKLYLTL